MEYNDSIDCRRAVHVHNSWLLISCSGVVAVVLCVCGCHSFFPISCSMLMAADDRVAQRDDDDDDVPLSSLST